MTMMSPSEEVIQRLREIVDPKNAGDKRVLEGCDYLYHRVSDEDLVALARALVCEKQDVEDALRIVCDGQPDTSLYLAALRLRVKAAALAKGLGGAPTTARALIRSESEKFSLPTTFAESQNIDDALRECLIPPEAVDPLRDLAFLIEVQKRRLIQQIREIGKAPSAFLMNKQMNATIESFKALVREMARMQVEFGLRRTVPRQIDLRVQGAFQNFMETVGTERDAVADLTKNLLGILEEDVVDVEFSEKS